MTSILIKAIRSLEIRTDRKSLRTFGYGLGVLLLSFSGIRFWSQGDLSLWLMVPGIACIGLSLISYRLLLVIYYPWMIAAKFLGMGITYLLLTLVFLLIITPLGLILRLRGKDALSRKWGDASYWGNRSEETDKRMNRMF